MKRFTALSLVFSLGLLAIPLFVLAARVGVPAPDFTGTASNNQTYHLLTIAESLWSSSGTTTAARILANTTRAATCRSCKSNGQPRA